MTRQRCPQCDAPIEPAAPFCASCGARELSAPRFDEFEAEVTRTEIQLQSPQLRARREHSGRRVAVPALQFEPGAASRTLTIGRDPGCDIVFDAPQISRRHVSLIFLGPGRWLVRDLGTANGTYLGDRQRRLTQAEVTHNDVLFLGSYRFPLSRIDDFTRPAPDACLGGPLSLPPEKSVITLGRGPTNDIVLQSPQVSRHHARLVRESGGLFLEDLSSANGTFVGGQRIRRSPVEHDQIFSLGSFALRLDLEKMRLQKSYRGDILLQAENLRVEVSTPQGPRRLLDGVSFTVYPTEIVGLLGPSGA